MRTSAIAASPTFPRRGAIAAVRAVLLEDELTFDIGGLMLGLGRGVLMRHGPRQLALTFASQAHRRTP
jgi:hypothetical protein